MITRIKLITSLCIITSFLQVCQTLPATQKPVTAPQKQSTAVKDIFSQACTCYYNHQLETAITLFQTVLDIDPAYVQAHVELARIYCEQDDLYQAHIHLKQALQHGIPQSIELAFTISNLMLTVGNPTDTLHILEHLYAVQPDNQSIMHNLSAVYKILGHYDRSVELLKKILTLAPDKEESNFALGHTLLAMGNFEQGWAQHERYLLRTNRYTKELKKLVRQGKLQGKHILLLQEGGLGDTIQWIRCAKTLKDAGAIITVCVPQSLIKLLSRCPYIDTLITPTKAYAPTTPIDTRTTIMSLPALLNMQELQMALSVPYIFPDKKLVEYWGSIIGNDNNFKIALCWQADIANDTHRLPFARRSIPIEKLALLGSIPKASFYSLQINVDREEINSIKDKMELTLFDDDFDQTNGPFMDSAAVIEHMDLVISVDTAIAHLAGALGKPVLLMLPYQTDWRWIANRSNCPWYPSMRIFKQPAPFDWDSVVLKIYQVLLEILD